MTFDRKIRERVKREGTPVPADFDRRISDLLETLPEQEPMSRRQRFPFRRAVLLGIAAVLIVGAGAAAPAVFSMTQGAIAYFNSRFNSEYNAQKEQFEKYNAAVGVSAENGQGETLTINNLAVDDSYMNIFYTLTSDEPIQKPGDDTDPESWREKWAAPIFWAEVDGEALDTSGSVQSEATFVDDCTIEGMHRLPLRDTLPDTFQLLLYTGGTSDKLDADFRFALTVDKSAVTVDSITLEPALDWHIASDEIQLPGDGPESVLHAESHDVRVERVSISPLSSTITLSEESEGPFASFVVRDDNGNYLPVHSSSGLTGSGVPLLRVKNMFEIIGADTDTKSLTLIPFLTLGQSHRVEGTLDSLPLTDDSEDGLTLEELHVGETEANARFSTRGAVYNMYGQCELLNAEGEIMDFTGGTYSESMVNRENGEITVTLYYPHATEEEVSSVCGVMFWQQDSPILLEDQALTIPLR